MATAGAPADAPVEPRAAEQLTPPRARASQLESRSSLQAKGADGRKGEGRQASFPALRPPPQFHETSPTHAQPSRKESSPARSLSNRRGTTFGGGGALCLPFIQSTTWLGVHLLTGSIMSAMRKTLRSGPRRKAKGEAASARVFQPPQVPLPSPLTTRLPWTFEPSQVTRGASASGGRCCKILAFLSRLLLAVGERRKEGTHARAHAPLFCPFLSGAFQFMLQPPWGAGGEGCTRRRPPARHPRAPGCSQPSPALSRRLRALIKRHAEALPASPSAGVSPSKRLPRQLSLPEPARLSRSFLPLSPFVPPFSARSREPGWRK